MLPRAFYTEKMGVDGDSLRTMEQQQVSIVLTLLMLAWDKPTGD